jgi:putative peptidoglycan lipid II flippase
VVYNIGIICGIIFLYPLFGIAGLAYGVVLGALFHVAVQIPVVVRHGMMPRLKALSRIDWPVIREVIGISLPRTLTLAFTQIIVTVLIALATRFGEGAASIFRFALTLNTVPVTLIGVSYSVAAFPSLVELFTKGDFEAFVKMVLRPARRIMFWSIPVMVVFIVFRAQIVRVLFGTGEFDWSDTRMTAAVLAVLVISVAARGLISLIVRGYYAAGKTWRPFMVNALSAVGTIAIAVVGVWLFDQSSALATWLESVLRVSDVAHARLLVLGLAYSIGTFINFFVLWWLFRREFKIERESLLFSRPVVDSVITSLLMGVVGYLGLQVFSTTFDLNTFFGVFFQGLLAGLLALVVGYITLIALGSSYLPRRLRFARRPV